LQQRRRGFVDRRVHDGVWMAVTGQEILQSDHVRAADRPDQRRAAFSGIDQVDTAQYQGAHQPFSQAGLGDQYLP
jgi:hypothetical protein